jgi:hypothetical protein
LAKEKWEERMDKLHEKLEAKYQHPGKFGAQTLVKIEFTNQ